MDCDCTDGEHRMFHIADKAIQIIRFGKAVKVCPVHKSTKCYCDPRPGFFREDR